MSSEINAWYSGAGYLAAGELVHDLLHLGFMVKEEMGDEQQESFTPQGSLED